MFGIGAVERAYSVLAAENRDLRDTIRREREAWATERKDLIDRIIALTKPQAASLLNPPLPNPKLLSEQAYAEPAQKKINYPGSNTRPPLPPYPKRAGESTPPESEAN